MYLHILVSLSTVSLLPVSSLRTYISWFHCPLSLCLIPVSSLRTYISWFHCPLSLCYPSLHYVPRYLGFTLCSLSVTRLFTMYLHILVSLSAVSLLPVLHILVSLSPVSLLPVSSLRTYISWFHCPQSLCYLSLHYVPTYLGFTVHCLSVTRLFTTYLYILVSLSAVSLLPISSLRTYISWFHCPQSLCYPSLHYVPLFHCPQSLCYPSLHYVPTYLGFTVYSLSVTRLFTTYLHILVSLSVISLLPVSSLRAYISWFDCPQSLCYPSLHYVPTYLGFTVRNLSVTRLFTRSSMV